MDNADCEPLMNSLVLPHLPASTFHVSRDGHRRKEAAYDASVGCLSCIRRKAYMLQVAPRRQNVSSRHIELCSLVPKTQAKLAEHPALAFVTDDVGAGLWERLPCRPGRVAQPLSLPPSITVPSGELRW